jgi:hypothetical protein
MDVEPQRLVEQLIRDQTPVRGDDDRVELMEVYTYITLRAAEVYTYITPWAAEVYPYITGQPLGLQHRYPEPFRYDLRGRRRQFPATSLPAVRPSQDCGDVVAFGESCEHVRAERCGRGDGDPSHAAA